MYVAVEIASKKYDTSYCYVDKIYSSIESYQKMLTAFFEEKHPEIKIATIFPIDTVTFQEFKHQTFEININRLEGEIKELQKKEKKKKIKNFFRIFFN